MNVVRRYLPGLLPPLLIGAVAYGLGRVAPVLGGPVVAILLGLLVGQVFGQRESWRPGATFASRTVLQASIVLLGATMSLGQVAATGGRTLPVLVGTLLVALIGGRLLARLLKVDGITGLLVTYGTGICGASAIATMSAVLGAPATSVALAVTVIVVYNVLGAVFFPLLGHAMHLSQESFGLWAGTAVNDTSSVVAAATTYGVTAVSVAVVVKLTRTLAIIPLALYESWRSHRGSVSRRRPVWWKLVPTFLVLFLVAAAARSVGVVPASWGPAVKELAYIGTTVAMAAVGMGSSLRHVRKAGWRPVALGGLLWVLVAGSSLLLQKLTGTL
ncbi:MAG TPA: putative sulfate exporter family transporter [Propionibacteriaceae bacterium]|nr:putative sulfate exporter family transporter [Propionibacteriaceae bacterium]